MKILLEKSKDIKDTKLFIENYLSENNLTKNDIFYEIEEESKKLLKAQKFTINIVKKVNIIEYVKNFIDNIASSFGLEINKEIKFNDDILSILLASNNNALLIGSNGKNLNAIEHLIRQSIKNNTNMNIKVHMDISNYKSKKINNLEYQIKKIAREVIETKVEAKLDPMNSYERRIVHNLINNYDKLETESMGEEPNRYIVIRVKE